MNITDEQNKQLAEVFALDETISDNRMVIRFDPETQQMWPGTAKRRLSTNQLKGAVVSHFVKNEGARTPSGGRFVSTRFTVKMADGTKWYGQTKKGTDEVRLRLAADKKGQ